MQGSGLQGLRLVIAQNGEEISMDHEMEAGIDVNPKPMFWYGV